LFVIKTENLKKDYLLGKVKIPALKGVDLEIKPAEFVIIYGPSGCGKTTLMSLLAGLDEPTEGEIYIRNQPLSRFTKNQLAKYRRSKIGMVFQSFNLIPSLTALENVILPLSLSGISKKEKIKRGQEVLEMVGLLNRANHKPTELSGGEQQRVAIARALAANPWILLVDEPTGNLDSETGVEIIKLLSEISRRYQRTIVLVTHNPDYFQFADRILYMKDGKIVKSLPTPRLRQAGQNRKSSIKYFIPFKAKGRIGIFDILRLAWAHFSFNRTRNFFTVLGVILGIAAIVGLVSIGVGLQNITTQEITASNPLLTISVTPSKTSAIPLDQKMAEEFKKIEGVSIVSPEISLTGQGTVLGTTTGLVISGYDPQFLDFEGIKISQGRAFESGKYEAILSRGALKSFDISEPEKVLNQELNLEILKENFQGLKSNKFKIVGVSSDDKIDNIYLPLDVSQQISQANYSQISIKVQNRKQIDEVRKKIEEKGFTTSSIKDLISEIDKAFLIIQIILGVVGGIALLVAALGIINTMTISLLERTHEIGILKAIGASDRDIRRLFLYEASLYGILGGILGVAIAIFIGQGVNMLINYLIRINGETGQLNIFVTPWIFALEMILFAVTISLLAGIYPARRATKLKPIEALRQE